MKEIEELGELQKEMDDALNKLVVVDFHATWCQPCKNLSPLIEELAKNYPGVVFVKVDVDAAEEIQALYQIEAMPTIKIFKNKKEVATVVGAKIDAIEDAIKTHK